MSEQPTTPLAQDSLIIDDAVIEKIAGVVTRQIDGILDMKGSLMSGFATSLGASSKSAKGITASVDGAAASIEIKAILEYGASPSDWTRRWWWTSHRSADTSRRRCRRLPSG